jgi:nucleoside 2-deoxyribosyltransferase
MVEGAWQMHAAMAVVDPQHSTFEFSGLAQSTASRLALILNSREAERLSGTQDVTLGADRLLTESGAEVLIVKHGIRGAYVVTGQGVTHVGAYPTSSVYPIGSGDAFTAGFAAAWIGNGEDPVEAARYASRVAAAYCATGIAQIDPSSLSEFQSSTPVPDTDASVYLAAPFFSPGERWLVEQTRDGLVGLGINVFSPLHDVGVGDDEVAEPDIAGLERCDGVLALLDGADPGTMFEVGWARHAILPVVAFSSNPASQQWTMLRGTGCEVLEDLSSASYRAGWAAMRHASGRT